MGLFSHLNDNIIKKIEQSCSRYIWYPIEQKNLVKLKTIKLTPEEGGLGMVYDIIYGIRGY